MTVERRTAALPGLTGSPGLAQGAYGDRGNLELLAPAAGGGLWVFWFNADQTEHRRGAARGCWSGGLHVFGGHDVRLARISQVSAGPRFLEAVALTGDGSLHRLYWTPDDGFVDAGVIATGVVAASQIVEAEAALHLLAVTTDSRVLHLRASLDTYPSATWTTWPVLAGASTAVLGPDLSAAALVDGAAHVLHYVGGWRTVRTVDGPWTDIALAGELVLGLDGDGRFAGVDAHAITAVSTTLDGGRIDVVLATAQALVHLHGDGRTWSEPRPIRSEVWLEPDAAIHRRAAT
jgi:hypothetical protein